MTDMEFYLPREAAEILRTTEAELASIRFRKTGPPYCKVGKRILYPKAALRQYLEDCMVMHQEVKP